MAKPTSPGHGLRLETLSREELLALATSALDELPEGHRVRRNAEVLVAHRMLLGDALSCSDESSIYADVQHGVILQLSLDALLVYARVCAGARAAANRRKLAVAASAGLPSAPPAERVRELCTPFPVAKRWLAPPHGARPYLVLAYTTPLEATKVLYDYIIAWGCAAVIDSLDSMPPDELLHPASTSAEANLAPKDVAAPLALLASLHLKITCHPISAKVVKLLKDAHAAGVGCGRPRVLMSRQAIVQAVQDCPLALSASSFSRPALLRHERVVNLLIQDLKSREYLREMDDDPNMLYYVC